MSVLAIANQKGGVGKTTTAINLAAALARVGVRILLIDNDPQSNTTSGLGLSPRPGASIYDVLADRAPLDACVHPTSEEGLFLVPASPDLAGGEIELAGAEAREFRLRDALAGIRDDYDYVLIDCSPSLGLLTLNALTAADGILIPVQCEYLALEGLGHLLRTIELVRQSLNPELLTAGLIMTMYDARTNLSQAVVDEVRGHFDGTFATVVPRSIRLSEAPSHGRTIFQYAPESRGAEAYRSLAQELLARVPPASAIAQTPPTDDTSPPTKGTAAPPPLHEPILPEPLPQTLPPQTLPPQNLPPQEPLPQKTATAPLAALPEARP